MLGAVLAEGALLTLGSEEGTADILGIADGVTVGTDVGALVGAIDGDVDGCVVGDVVGDVAGDRDGWALGEGVFGAFGEVVGTWSISSSTNSLGATLESEASAVLLVRCSLFSACWVLTMTKVIGLPLDH